MDCACFSHYKDEAPPCQPPSMLISFPAPWVADAGREDDLTLRCPQPTYCCHGSRLLPLWRCRMVPVCLQKGVDGTALPAVAYFPAFFPQEDIQMSDHIYGEHVETRAKNKRHTSGEVWKDANGALTPSSSPVSPGFVFTKSLGWQMQACGGSRLTSYIRDHGFVCPAPACAAVPAKRRSGLRASGPQ